MSDDCTETGTNEEKIMASKFGEEVEKVRISGCRYSRYKKRAMIKKCYLSCLNATIIRSCRDISCGTDSTHQLSLSVSMVHLIFDIIREMSIDILYYIVRCIHYLRTYRVSISTLCTCADVPTEMA